MAGIECNIIEGATGDILMVSDGTDRFAIAGRGRPHEEQKHVFYFDMLNGVDREKKIDGRSNWWGKTYPWHDVKGFRGERINGLARFEPNGEGNFANQHATR